MSQKTLFIDRDGTIISEPPEDFQVDRLDKLAFEPEVIPALLALQKAGYQLVMITNQDGLGSESFPENTFWPVQNFVMKTLEGEGIVFDAVLIDKTLPAENANTRKPGTGMVLSYMNNEAYDCINSFVIGDRVTDMQLAKNLGCKAIWLNTHPGLGMKEITDTEEELRAKALVLETKKWSDIYAFLKEQSKSM
jgi:imidazoleglycerol-phosphate dehydratase/histidinol-phosphatase